MPKLSRDVDGSVVLTVSGEVDTGHASWLAQQVARYAAAPKLAIDMSDVTLVSAEGLAVLAEAASRFLGAGGGIAIAIGEHSAEVLHTVEAARLQHALRLFDTVHNALNADVRPSRGSARIAPRRTQLHYHDAGGCSAGRCVRSIGLPPGYRARLRPPNRPPHSGRP
jgi:anti-anti-sigma factor